MACTGVGALSSVDKARFGPAVAIAVILGGLILAGCASVPTSGSGEPVDPLTVAAYAPPQNEPFRVPAVRVSKVDSQYLRQTVPTPPTISEPAGTIVVDPYGKFLYLVQDSGQSLRYGIGVGRQGFSWAGKATIQEKQAWPKWFPPQEMQERDRFAARFPDGMRGGPRNPLGSRALYLYEGKCNGKNTRTEACKDTLYRLHGTYEQDSIGQAVSSGCIRLFQQDIIDLYERVPLGTRVVVLPGPGVPEGLSDPTTPAAPVTAALAPAT
ncbi:MAG: L,D-transpeptidase [Hyphomicrobiales bacterium]|nr:L,D-transpeptidase [Hyphomicrobiales bacterium]